jgi:hypothetical protein
MIRATSAGWSWCSMWSASSIQVSSDVGEAGAAGFPVAGPGGVVADDPGLPAGDPEHRAGDLAPDGHRFFQPEQVGRGGLVPRVAVPDDAVAPLAAAGFAVADAGQVFGQVVGPFRRQKTVALQQAAGEGGAVLGRRACAAVSASRAQPLPVAFRRHVRRRRRDAEALQRNDARHPFRAQAGIQAGEDAAHAVADQRTGPSGA